MPTFGIFGETEKPGNAFSTTNVVIRLSSFA